MAVSEGQVRAALQGVVDPAAIDGVAVRDGLVQVSLRTDRARAAAMEAVRDAAERAVAGLAGVSNASVVLTAHREAAPPAPRLMPGVRHVVAVASGKGGVGKSTVAVNVAVALARQGLRVGLLDADVHGPSLPRMLGVSGKPELRNKKMIPLERWGLRVMSIGLLVDADAAMIWRGPMVMGALTQMMGEAEWGELDILVVDMPPGTGDAQLTMAQKGGMSGAVIVSTPQDIALIDARRGVRMFEKTNVPVLGVVENMSVFCCPACGTRTELFGHGGARREAAALGVPFLGEVPLLLAVREAGDAGVPIVQSAPDSAAGVAFTEIAARVWGALPR